MSLRVLAFVPHPPAGASGRYRAYQMVSPLRDLGVEMEIRPFLNDAGFDRLYRPGQIVEKAADLTRGVVRRWGALADSAKFDVTFIHRELWPVRIGPALERLTGRQPRFVFDFDDAVFLPNVSVANRSFRWLKSADQAQVLTARATAISAGNAWLAEWAGRIRGATHRIQVVPTCVDTARWRPGRGSAGPVRVVWTGSHSTVHYLEVLRTIWPRLVQRRSDIELHVMGARFDLPNARVVHHDWSEAAEFDLVRCADIGLAPLEDDPWARGKCGLKLLLYMACGLGVVASPVGVHREMIDPGRSGLFAESPAAMEEALDRLITDRALRESLGREARTSVEARFSVRAVAPKLATVLHEGASGATH